MRSCTHGNTRSCRQARRRTLRPGLLRSGSLGEAGLPFRLLPRFAVFFRVLLYPTRLVPLSSCYAALVIGAW